MNFILQAFQKYFLLNVISVLTRYVLPLIRKAPRN